MFLSNRGKFNKGVAALFVFLLLVSSFSPIFARKAEAWIFTDWVNFAVNVVTSISANALWVKEYALDAVAYQVMNLVIERMAASTVKWINSGFQGKPAYVTDPTAYFGNIGNGIAGQYIMTNPNLNFLCGPINARIRIALSRTYNSNYGDQRWRCTLDDAVGNMEDFMNDFEKGGWDKFFRLTQERQNNPIGAYLQAEGDMFDQIATKLSEKDKELSWGSGFMSSKECVETGPAVEMYDARGNEIDSYLIPGPCLKERTETPGSVIENKLNDVLNIGNEKLAVADEINEIMSALLNQLMSRVVGGIGGGLSGMSKPDPTNGTVFTTQLSNTSRDSQIDKYFQESQQNVNDVLDLPTPNLNACRENPNLPECLPPPNDPNNPNPICDPTVQPCP